jgi:P27 family predicted phage terminase small subunit
MTEPAGSPPGKIKRHQDTNTTHELVSAVPLEGDGTLDWSTTPEDLDGRALAEWHRLCGAFDGASGRFREGDRTALVTYCTWVGVFLDASDRVRQRGVLIGGRSSADKARGEDAGMVKNPAEAIMRNASQQVRYWARELGLTPAARASMKISVPTSVQAEDPNDPFD